MLKKYGWMALCLALAGGAACSDDSTTNEAKGDFVPELSGKDDQSAFSVSEVERIRPSTGPGSGLRQQTLTGKFTNGHLRGHRMYAWPGQTVELKLTSNDFDTYLMVEGPSLGSDDLLTYNDDADGTNSALSVTFNQGGVYRVLVSSFDFAAGENGDEGDYTLAYTCTANCEMPEMSLQELIDELRTTVGQEGLEQLVAGYIPQLFQDEEVAALVQAQAQAALQNGVPEAFPVLPLGAASLAQAIFEHATPAGDPPAPTTFDVQVLLEKGCVPDRPTLAPVNPALPDLVTGGWADLSYGDCALQHAHDFANVLNNLALDNGSKVINGDETYTTIGQVIDALYASGHTIEATNSRYFANFLGLWYKGRAVRAAAWLDTGIDIGNGETFALPSPHTHHNFYIRGPLVNVDIMYYMGVSNGTSFRAVSDIRPVWSGGRDLHTYSSENGDAQKIKEIFETAAQLRKRWEAEGRGLPMSGYGQLGVCNDSTAVLELQAEELITIYPLVRREPNAEDTSNVANLLRGLPNDLAQDDPQNAANRIRTTMPFADLADMPFPELRENVSRLP